MCRLAFHDRRGGIPPPGGANLTALHQEDFADRLPTEIESENANQAQ
jgi:hypothetical protein